MMTMIKFPEGDALDALSQRFAEISADIEAAAAIVEGHYGSGTPRYGLSELFDYITNPQHGADPDLERALEQNPRLSAIYDGLVAQTSVAYFGQLKAADSQTTVTRRRIDGYEVRVTPAETRPDEVIVVIELVRTGMPTPQLLLIKRGRLRLRYELPRAIGRIIQLIEPAGSPLVEGLRDIYAEIDLV